jgi:hypothetical protein
MTAKYAIAKYISDLDRQEAVNIGIIAWTKGSVCSKFIDVDDAEFIVDQQNYRRWQDYWEDLMRQRSIQVFRERTATINSQRFFDQLLLTGSGNYRLENSGEVPDATKSNLADVVAFLYNRLVVRERPVNEREPGLLERCNQFLKEIGLSLRDDFRRRYPLKVSFGGRESEIHFDYGSGEIGRPRALFNRVNVSREDSVLVAVGKCNTAQNQLPNCNRQNCFSLYDSTLESGEFDATVSFLESFSVPIDIANKQASLEQLQSVLSVSI